MEKYVAKAMATGCPVDVPMCEKDEPREQESWRKEDQKRAL